MWKSTGKQPAQLANAPALPETLGYIWDWFLEVCSGNPLTYTELAHWAALTRRQLTSLEVDLLKELDHQLRRARHE